MKTCFAFFAAGLLSVGHLVAQDLVSAGTIASFSKEGTLGLVPESRTGNPIYFSNMDKAVVYYAGGGRAPITELHPGQTATIHYRPSSKQVIVAKIVVPNPAPSPFVGIPVVPLGIPGVERRVIGTKVLQDRDITTQPGAKAHIDNDITTQPGKVEPGNTDITKHADRR